MAKKLENLEQTIESILFVYGEPLSTHNIAKITQSPVGEVTLALGQLQNNLCQRGIRLINHNNDWQLTTPAELGIHIEKLVKGEMQAELTPASLEVLTICAYHGPAAKTQIESIRGVNSTYALRNLMLRGLVERAADGSHKKTYKYEISLTALRKLGLTQKEDLPQYRELKNEIVKTEQILNSV